MLALNCSVLVFWGQNNCYKWRTDYVLGIFLFVAYKRLSKFNEQVPQSVCNAKPHSPGVLSSPQLYIYRSSSHCWLCVILLFLRDKEIQSSTRPPLQVGCCFLFWEGREWVEGAEVDGKKVHKLLGHFEGHWFWKQNVPHNASSRSGIFCNQYMLFWNTSYKTI